MITKDQAKPVSPADLPIETEITSRWCGWQPGDPAKVSIICTAFNHERYIQDAICGFLIQKTDFPFEILIHDDASTDKTRKIIESYARKYPNLIRPTYQTENQYSKGTGIFSNILLPQSTGEYIALCEGDDYWICEQKLARQIEILDADSTLAVSFHDVFVVRRNSQSDSHIKEYNPDLTIAPEVFTLEQVAAANWLIPTCSAVFRKSCYRPLDLKKRFPNGDFLLWMTLGISGNYQLFPKNMGVYRRTNPFGLVNNRSMFDNFQIQIYQIQLFAFLRQEGAISESFFLEFIENQTNKIIFRTEKIKNKFLFKLYSRLSVWRNKRKMCS